MKQLLTKWGKDPQAEVHTEYPRPTLTRDSFLNLNGEWEFELSEALEVDQYSRSIKVPFAPETYLSEVKEGVLPKDYLHYRKVFSLPKNFKEDRVILHFGAVDQECIVYLNGAYVGQNTGGYLAFSFDVTDEIRESDNELVVVAKDYTEQKAHARGKQKLVKKGKYGSLFYTPTSGIWKTVWLESVANHYIEGIKTTPNYDESSIMLKVRTNQEITEKAQVEIKFKGEIVVTQEIYTNKDQIISIENFEAWSPDQPNLYDVVVSYQDDEVASYFGMRKLSIDRDSKGILRYYLNNEPFFYNGVLDQGYWPDGGMTPPTDEALIFDIEQMKALGYNTLRKHVKIESERFYSHCDRLGMMVWQDMPNGGGPDYNMYFVTYLANASNWINRRVKDDKYKLFKRDDAWGRTQYYEDLTTLVNQLYNHPSIAAWVPFNEGWGQFDANKATELIRELDPNRIVIETSGWFDQKGGDSYTIHNYQHILSVSPQDRVVSLTEYGGYAYPIEEHSATNHKFGYQYYTSVEELTANYTRLWEEEIYPNVEKGLSTAIYTQLSDVEEEVNGVFTYDREVCKLEGDAIRELNDRLYRLFREVTQ